MLGEPLRRSPGGHIEAIDVGVEVTAGEEHEPLGLASCRVALDAMSLTVSTSFSATHISSGVGLIHGRTS